MREASTFSQKNMQWLMWGKVSLGMCVGKGIGRMVLCVCGEGEEDKLVCACVSKRWEYVSM